MSELQPGRYRHFKGNEYQVLGLATHSETGETVVRSEEHTSELQSPR